MQARKKICTDIDTPFAEFFGKCFGKPTEIPQRLKIARKREIGRNLFVRARFANQEAEITTFAKVRLPPLGRIAICGL